MAFLSFYDYEKLLCDNMLLSWTVIFTYNRKQCTYITLKHNAYCSTINVLINVYIDRLTVNTECIYYIYI